MTLPQVIIDVGFASPTVSSTVFVIGDPNRGKIGGVGLLGDDDIWTDITPYVRTWSVRRGATRGDDPTMRYEPGTCTIELNDGDRRFDPENATGPYSLGGVSQIEPMRRVRIRAIWDGVTYPVFSGFADDWAPAYQGNSWTYTTLTATDAQKVFAAYDRTGGVAVGAGEDSGARIDRILDGVGWPADDRVIDVGDSTLQATELTGNTLTELLLVQDSEQGEFYVDASGRTVFRRRLAMIEEPRSTTPQVVFGDGGYYPTSVWNFEDGVGAFTATGATITASAAEAQSGTQSMLMTVVGSPALAYPRQIYGLPVVAGHSYTGTIWVLYPNGGSVSTAIDWSNSGGYISTSSGPTVVPAGVWTQLSITGTAPLTATRAGFGPTLTGSPATGTELYVDSMTLADDDNEIPYADAHPSVGDDGMANTITASRAGGTEQTVQDTTSVTRYLVKTFQRLDLLLQTDAAVLEWANIVKYQFATPARRFSSVDFNTARIDTQVSQWPQVLGREFADRITVRRRPAGGGALIERDCFVRGVTHESDGVAWRSTFVLQSAERYSFFIVGDAVLGRLDSNALSF